MANNLPQDSLRPFYLTQDAGKPAQVTGKTPVELAFIEGILPMRWRIVNRRSGPAPAPYTHLGSARMTSLKGRNNKAQGNALGIDVGPV